MNKMKIRKNDEIIVLKGKDKGKTGKVLKVNTEKRTVIVEKIKFAKEFIRRDQSKNIQGGIMEKEAPIHVSNLMLYCSECKKGVRVSRTKDGEKPVRKCKVCGHQFD